MTYDEMMRRVVSVKKFVYDEVNKKTPGATKAMVEMNMLIQYLEKKRRTLSHAGTTNPHYSLHLLG